MKKLLALLVAGAFIVPAMAAEEAKPEVKKSCITQKDPKTGKEKEVCKEIKVHKKLEGHAIPPKK